MSEKNLPEQPKAPLAVDSPAPCSASVRKIEVLWTDGRIVGGTTVNNPEALKAALCRAVDEGWKYIEAKTPNASS